MSSSYAVWAVSPVGERLVLLGRLVRLESTNTVNAVGIQKIRLKNDFDLARFIQEDTRIEVWRRVGDGNLTIDSETVWFVRDWEEVLNRAGRNVNITAYSANDEIDRPIVAYASGTAQAKKTDLPLDDAMKAFIRENLGELATDPTRNFSTYISVAPDLSQAPVSSISAAWDDVLRTLRDLAQDSDEKGVRLFFGMVYNPNNGIITFETRINQWGVDHSVNKDSRVILSVLAGTLSEIRQKTITSVEKNVMYVGGQGPGINRDIVTAVDVGRLAVSPLNRRERFVNATQVKKGNFAELRAIGDARLKENRLVELFSAKVRDSKAVKFGREYKLGDRVLVETTNRIFPARIDTVKTLVERGRETINVGLRAD